MNEWRHVLRALMEGDFEALVVPLAMFLVIALFMGLTEWSRRTHLELRWEHVSWRQLAFVVGLLLLILFGAGLATRIVMEWVNW